MGWSCKGAYIQPVHSNFPCPALAAGAGSRGWSGSPPFCGSLMTHAGSHFVICPSGYILEPILFLQFRAHLFVRRPQTGPAPAAKKAPPLLREKTHRRKGATMLYLTLEDNPFPEQKYDENALLEVGRGSNGCRDETRSVQIMFSTFLYDTCCWSTANLFLHSVMILYAVCRRASSRTTQVMYVAVSQATSPLVSSCTEVLHNVHSLNTSRFSFVHCCARCVQATAVIRLPIPKSLVPASFICVFQDIHTDTSKQGGTGARLMHAGQPYGCHQQRNIHTQQA